MSSPLSERVPGVQIVGKSAKNKATARRTASEKRREKWTESGHLTRREECGNRRGEQRAKKRRGTKWTESAPSPVSPRLFARFPEFASGYRFPCKEMICRVKLERSRILAIIHNRVLHFFRLPACSMSGGMR